MCLTYCIALNLLQAIEVEEQGRRTGRWNREEGKKVVNVLGEKSLIKTSTFEGNVKVTNHLKKAKQGCTISVNEQMNTVVNVFF